MDVKAFWERTKEKLAGARKSMTVFIAFAWSSLAANVNEIQPYMANFPQWFGEHLAQWISAFFGAMLIFVRLYHTSGPIEAKLAPKAEEPPTP